MDALANNPERFTKPEIEDTGETRLHLLAREGKVEILESLLKDPRIRDDLVSKTVYNKCIFFCVFVHFQHKKTSY